jgi:hypothetical protein
MLYLKSFLTEIYMNSKLFFSIIFLSIFSQCLILTMDQGSFRRAPSQQPTSNSPLDPTILKDMRRNSSDLQQGLTPSPDKVKPEDDDSTSDETSCIENELSTKRFVKDQNSENHQAIVILTNGETKMITGRVKDLTPNKQKMAAFYTKLLKKGRVTPSE